MAEKIPSSPAGNHILINLLIVFHKGYYCGGDYFITFEDGH
jgi:hypothetical protein